MNSPKKLVIEHGFERSSSMYRNFSYLFKNPFWNKKVPNGFSVCPYFWFSLIGFFFRLITPIIQGFIGLCSLIAMFFGKRLTNITNKLNIKLGMNWTSVQYVALFLLLVIGLIGAGFLGLGLYKALIIIHKTPESTAFFYTLIYIIIGIITCINYHKKYKETNCKPVLLFILSLLGILTYYNFLFEWGAFSAIGDIFMWFCSIIWEFILFIPEMFITLISFSFIYLVVFIIIIGFCCLVSYFEFIDYTYMYYHKLENKLRNSFVKFHVTTIAEELGLDRNYVFDAVTKYIFDKEVMKYARKIPTSEIIENILEIDIESSERKFITDFKNSKYYKELEKLAAQVSEARKQKVVDRLSKTEKIKKRRATLGEICSAFWGWINRNIFSWFAAFYHAVKNIKSKACPHIYFKGEEEN